jgi:hypothetical protein
MVWLRDLIRQVAASIQIIVFTCRPSDYLLPNEIEMEGEYEGGRLAVRSTDLLQVIDNHVQHLRLEGGDSWFRSKKVVGTSHRRAFRVWRGLGDSR